MFKIVPLSQNDPRWKLKRLGFDQSSTLGSYGCLLTCATMVANGLGFNETPDSLNNKMKAVKGFQGAFLVPGMLPRALPGLLYKRYIPCQNQPAPVSEIDATLAAGLPVIVEVDYSPKAGMQNHWIVIVDKQGDDYVIKDPYPYPVETKVVTLKGRYGFAGTLAKIITGVMWLDGSNRAGPSTPPAPGPGTTKPAPKPIPTSGFAVYSQADGLAIRTSPVVTADNLIKRVPMNTRLYVSEDATAAKAKIGQVNQWIKVIETGEGYEGYTAAWYVAAEEPQPEPAPGPVPPGPATPPVPAPPQAGLRVFSTAEGLAIRRQPMISNANLIKRVPHGAEFIVIEPAPEAEAKIGIEGQWLKVRDVECTEGFVAAWYVSKERQDPPLGVIKMGLAPTPFQQEPGKLVVRAIVDNLAIRSRPQLSEKYLLRRAPLHSEFMVLDPEEGEEKIGKMGQWLRVQDVDGIEGYVAGWYVMKRETAKNP